MPLITRSYQIDNIKKHFENIHIMPSLFASIFSIITFSVIFYMMDQYVINSSSSVFIFGIGSYMVYTTYFTIDYYLNIYSSSYQKCNMENKFYVLSNLIKSALLFVYTPFASIILYNAIYLDHWDNKFIKNLGSLYCIPDFISLILVSKMQTATFIHHICVCILTCITLINDFNQINIWRSIVIYAIFSTFAYAVNFLLASRYLNIRYPIKLFLTKSALFIYITCCGINWTWQSLYIYKLISDNNNFFIYLYIFLMCLLIYDDLQLIKYLHFKTFEKKN